MHTRRLTDADRPALFAFLAPTEARSTFLVGNAREHGIDDRGGLLQGTWLGAFDDGGALRGVLAHFRGPNSWTPACEGHADLLVPAMARATGAAPRVVVGTRERVAEVKAHAPPSWRVASTALEVLLVLHWDRYRRPADATALPLPAERAEEGAALHELLQREWSLPVDPPRLRTMAERVAREGKLLVREVDGRAVATSCEVASTGRYAHVGATMCLREYRRRGLAGACVAAVVERARDAGRASEGAVLFTNEENVGAIALYEGMGFVREAAWEMCFVEEGEAAAG